METAVLGIVHLVVESTTFYGAVAKGGPPWTTSPRTARSRPSPVPTMARLDCEDCGRATDHQFETHESIPDET